MVLSRTEFEKVLRRYGPITVLEAIHRRQEDTRQLVRQDGAYIATTKFDSKACRAAYQDLFRAESGEELYKLYLETSKGP